MKLIHALIVVVGFGGLAACLSQAVSPAPNGDMAPTGTPTGTPLPTPTNTPSPTATLSIPTLPAIPQPTFEQPTVMAGPTFTPTPGQIAFVSDTSGHDQLYLMNSDGSDIRPLTGDSHDNRDPVWSPDGTHLAFTRLVGVQEEMAGPNGMVIRSVESAEIIVMDADGSNPVSLTHDLTRRGLAAFNPVWSPDGETIAFEAAQIERVGNSFAGWNIYVVDAGGSGELRRLTAWETGTGVGCVGAEWLPDSQRILTYCRSLMQAGVVLHDVEDEETGLVITEGQGARFYGASSSGLLAVSDGYDLWTFGGIDFSDATGVEFQRPLLPTGYYAAIVALAWSPVADRFAVRTGYNLLVSDVAGSQAHEWVGSLPTDEAIAALSWSPDGSQLVFVATLDGNQELMLVALDQTGAMRLTETPFNESQPVWQP